MSTATTSNEDAVLARIQKLLAMTEENGCTAEEAASAMTLVNALMQEYNLTLTDVAVRNAPIIEYDLELGASAAERSMAVQLIAAAIAQLWGLKIMRTMSVAPGHRRRTLERLTLIGARVDTLAAGDSISWLIDQGKRLGRYQANKTAWWVGYRDGPMCLRSGKRISDSARPN